MEKKMQKETNVANNLLFSILNSAILGLVNLAYPIFIGLLYNPITMGNFSVLNSWAIILSIPIVNGIAPSVSRFIATNSENENNELEKIGIDFSIIYLLLILILFPILSAFIYKLTFLEIFLVFVLLLFTIFHYLFRYIMQGFEQFKKLLYFELVGFLVFLPLGIIFCFFSKLIPILSVSGNYYLLLVPMVVYHLVFDLTFIIIQLRKSRLGNLIKINKILAVKILKYAFFIGFSNILILGLSQIQIIISDNYLSELEVGILSFWNSAISPISLITVSLATILIPRLTNLQINSIDLSLDFTNSINWGLSLLIIPLAGMIYLIIAAYPQIFDLIIPSEYYTSIYWPIIILLSLKEVSNILWCPTTSMFATTEKDIKYNALVSLLYTIFVIVSWIIFIPLLGIFGFAIGIAIGSVLSYFSTQIIALIIYKKKIGSQILFSLIVFGIFGLGYYLISLIPIVVLIIWSILSVVLVILGIIKITKVLKMKEYSTRYQSEAEIPSSIIELE